MKLPIRLTLGTIKQYSSKTLLIRAIRYITLSLIIVSVVILMYAVVVNYFSYSYAQVSEAGEIIKSKNFQYEVKKIVYKGSPAYVIAEKYDKDNLEITTSQAATADIVLSIDGIRITFISSGFGNPIIETDFKIRIRR